jgi:hypothetical protein
MQEAQGALFDLGTQGGVSLAHPQEATIRRQNAERIARRRAAATIAEQGAGGRDSLTREGPRPVGGTFETLQAVPERKPMQQVGLSEEDLLSFLRAFQFDPRSETIRTPDKLVQTQTTTIEGGGLA